MNSSRILQLLLQQSCDPVKPQQRVPNETAAESLGFETLITSLLPGLLTDTGLVLLFVLKEGERKCVGAFC